MPVEVNNSRRRGDEEASIIFRSLKSILIVEVETASASFQERPLSNRRFALRRKISLLIIVAFVSVLAAINYGCSTSSDADFDGPDPSFSLDLTNPTLKERLGEDDGYSMAIFFGADIHGSLETCG
jgi:hypothetical protein